MQQTRNTVSQTRLTKKSQDPLSLASSSQFTPSSRSPKASQASKFRALDFSNADNLLADNLQRFLMDEWLNSKLNLLPHDKIRESRSFLWAFGDNRKRALSV